MDLAQETAEQIKKVFPGSTEARLANVTAALGENFEGEPGLFILLIFEQGLASADFAAVRRLTRQISEWLLEEKNSSLFPYITVTTVAEEQEEAQRDARA